MPIICLLCQGFKISEKVSLFHFELFLPHFAQSFPMPTVDVSGNRWFVGGLLSEIFCILVPRLHSCCWKGYRNDNWYKRSCKPESENSQTTVWRLSKLKDFLMNLDISYRRKCSDCRKLDSIKVVDILARLFISILQQVSQFNLRMMTIWEILSIAIYIFLCPWVRNNGFTHSTTCPQLN